MEFTAQAIAQLINGEIEGNPTSTVNTFAKIEEGKPGALSFLANIKYEEYIYTCKSSIIIIADDLVLKSPVNATLIKVKNPYESFAVLLQYYEQSKKDTETGVSEHIILGNDVSLGNHLYIDAFCRLNDKVSIGDGSKLYSNVYLGKGVKIGKNTVIYANVSIYANCEIGDNCIIHSGAVIGADGFGFAPNENGEFTKIPQIGNVLIEDGVEIGANTTIDRATMGSTKIGKGVKLDNLVQIGHNVEIGANTVIAGQTGVSGSTKIGANCKIGGQVGIAGHLTIADGITIGAKTGVISDLKDNTHIWLGAPAQPISDFKRSFIMIKSLPKLIDRVKELEKKWKNNN